MIIMSHWYLGLDDKKGGVIMSKINKLININKPLIVISAKQQLVHPLPRCQCVAECMEA